MDVGVKLQRNINRDMTKSPERTKRGGVPSSRVMNPFRRVQVVYYLTRNGQLEHPHYMEVSHLTNQQLRLKDVMDRLTVLRGKGMPSLYSWSCKRSYKSGYVWNDLTENDIIQPAEGAEYVLKGSELIQGSTERFEQLQISNQRHQIPEPNFHSKRHYKPLLGPPPPPPPNFHRDQKRQEPHNEVHNNDNNTRYLEEEEFEEEDDEEEEEEGENYTSSNTPLSRCSKGVSTDEIEELQPLNNNKSNSNNVNHLKNNPTQELTLVNHSSPPSTSSTDGSKRFEDGDPDPDPGSGSRRHNSSVLLHLITCGSGGGSAVAACKAKCTKASALKKSSGAPGGASEKKMAAEAAEEEEMSCMSMNPRLLGRVLAAEKEYFSGSIAESMMEEHRVVSTQPQLKKSSSYNEERTIAGDAAEGKAESRKKQAKAGKAKCIPRKKPSSSSSKLNKK